jgi:hypothetical protein
MSNFFITDDGEELQPTTEFVNTGLQPLIPDGTPLHCAIAGATWEAATDFKNQRIEILLHVIEKGPYKGFIVKDTVKVFDDKVSIRDKAKTKLMTYDTLCKGLLLKASKTGKDIVNDNGLLARALNGGEVMATFAEYDIVNPNGSDNFTGNWVRVIEAKGKRAEDAHIIKQAGNSPQAPIAKTVIEEDFEDENMHF